MQAEVVPSKYHYHQIRMKGWRGVEHAGVKETQRRGLAACISDPSSVSVSPSCSHLHGSALHHSDTNKGKGGGGRSQRHNHSSARDKAYDGKDTPEWQTDKQEAGTD